MEYISDIIKSSAIKKWEKTAKENGGCKVFISSPTGSGKSTFIHHSLAEFCSSKNWNILLITNRKILKDQVDNYLDEIDNENIHTVNYQSLESRILSDKKIFLNYDIIVMDEVHYLLNDSSFNRNTDLLLNLVKRAPENKICIYMTATPEAIFYYNNKFDYSYELKSDYSYIDKLLFYEKDDDLKTLLSGREKILYFCNSAKIAYEKSLLYEDASFICSENNKKYYIKSSRKEKNNLIKHNKFNSKILFTTQVLDSGVNIKDSNLKNVVIDILDPISLIQCLGRKRILNSDDKINLYIKNHNKGELVRNSIKLKKKLDLVSELRTLGKREFVKKYRKGNLDDVIDNDMSVNYAKYYNYKYYQNLYYRLQMDKDGFGYARYICKKLNFKFRENLMKQDEFEKENIENLIIKNLDRKLIDLEKDDFRDEFFKKIIRPKKSNYRNNGLNSINKILKELGLNYYVTSNVIKRDGKCVRYWQVERIDVYEEVE